MPDAPASDLTLYRAFVPRWAFQPLSGEGAARFGGRWNPVGQPAIYAALEPSTAWAEYNQGFVSHPATIVELRLSSAKLADTRQHTVLKQFGRDAQIHKTEWRELLDAGAEPPTHDLHRHLLEEAGYDGVIYPSFMSRGGTCVALWRWNEGDGPRLEVVDPELRLLKTQASWME